MLALAKTTQILVRNFYENNKAVNKVIFFNSLILIGSRNTSFTPFTVFVTKRYICLNLANK